MKSQQGDQSGSAHPESGTAAEPKTQPRSRPGALANGFANTARWVGRGIVVVIGLVILWYVMGYLWSVVFPILLALLLSSILWPINKLLRHIMPRVLAALLSIVLLLVFVGGLIWWVLPSFATESATLIGQARASLREFNNFLMGPPLNLANADLNALLDAGLQQLRQHAGDIVSGITSGLGMITSGTIAFLLVIVFVFFCLKDGDKFLPWAGRWTSAEAYVHTEAISTRAWSTLSGYITAQAAVALVDAVFIGLGLWFLDVPLALVLSVLIFFAAFIPIVGAVSTGLLASLVALISLGWGTALIVLALVIVVQQLESNILQPVFVGQTLKIHPAVVLASVVVGGTLFGIVGAFLAVPVTAVGIVVFRYVHELTFPEPPESGEEPTADEGTDSEAGKAAGTGKAADQKSSEMADGGAAKGDTATRVTAARATAATAVTKSSSRGDTGPSTQ